MPMPHKKFERLREKVQRKKTSRRAKERAKARKKRKSRERVEANEPETRREEALATVRQTRLLAAELGVSTDRAREIQQRASNTLDSALDQGGDALEKLDVDNDGDTDLLSIAEAQADRDSKDEHSEFVSPAEPVLDLSSEENQSQSGSGSKSSDRPDVMSKDGEEDILGL